jgi:hypothetical protein
MRRRSAAVLAALVGAAPLVATVPLTAQAGTGPATAPGEVSVQRGTVVSSGAPARAARVTLYEAGTRQGAPAKALGTDVTNARGAFRIAYREPRDADAVLYLLSDSRPSGVRGAGPPAWRPVRLAAVLPADPPHRVVLTERTTVATAYAMAQFLDDGEIAGPAPGLPNAAGTAQNLANVATGGVARVLATPPNGGRTTTRAAFDSLADVAASCDGRAGCARLFALTRAPGQPRARDTLQALVNIAHAPAHKAARLFAVAQTDPLFRPGLTEAPDAWTLALRYVGNGHELDGPGNVAFDAEGNAWIGNNYVFRPDPARPACGGRLASKLTPTGEDAPGAPFRGGGLYGVGYGTVVDPSGDVWFGNFGFQGSGCPLDHTRLFRSVSQFAPDGTALSPRRGWRNGDIRQPQGMASDRRGTIWVANCGNDSVTRIPRGVPADAENIRPRRLVKPFDVTVDARGRTWASGNNSSNVLLLSRDGRVLRDVRSGGINAPMGVASDSLGNVWVANSGIVDPPCGSTTPELFWDLLTEAENHDPSVTMVHADGTTPRRPFRGGGLTVPWGIAVDGENHVWVSNFAGQTVSELCGADTGTCPPGHRTGQPISPPTGYTFDGLVRSTAVQIDPSGNVWAVNNWETVPLQTNPGGRQVVVFVGLAAPVRTPLVGAPRTP